MKQKRYWWDEVPVDKKGEEIRYKCEKISLYQKKEQLISDE